jgi:hypothetical protein
MKMNKRWDSCGSMFTDINQGALPALLPLFKETGLSYTAAGIILVGNLTAPLSSPPRISF